MKKTEAKLYEYSEPNLKEFWEMFPPDYPPRLAFNKMILKAMKWDYLMKYRKIEGHVQEDIEREYWKDYFDEEP